MICAGGELVNVATVCVSKWTSWLNPCCQCIAHSTWCYQEVCITTHTATALL